MTSTGQLACRTERRRGRERQPVADRAGPICPSAVSGRAVRNLLHRIFPHTGGHRKMLHNMFIGNPAGNTDRILDSTAVTGTLFFTPTADFLDNPPPLPGSGATTALPAPAAARRLVGDRQHERKVPMNNLYRELAPVTESAWRRSNWRQPEPSSAPYRRTTGGRCQRPMRRGDRRGRTGHLLDVAAPGEGVIAHLRDAQPLVRLRCRSRCRATRSTTSNADRRTRTGTR